MKRLLFLAICVSVVAAALILATNSKAISAVAQAIVTCATTGPCTEGNNTSTGAGLLGQSKSGHGVIGNTLFNSSGPSNGESAVFGQDLSTVGTFDMGVQGISTRGYGVRGKSQSNDGVRGDTTTGFGVHGVSPNNIGVRGESTLGFGVSGIGGNEGVRGETTSGFGVLGSATTGTGVAGGGALGVFASGDTGIESVSNAGNAVFATSLSGDAIVATAQGTSHWALIAQSLKGSALDISGGNRGIDTTGGLEGVIARSSQFPIVATDAAGNNLFWVDNVGNLHFKGELISFGTSSATASMTHGTSPATEETGTARLAFGSANVYFSSAFARAVDPRHGYQVFLTPSGDTRGLFVAAKYSGGFVVREVQGGRGSFSFDYHVYAQTAPTSQSMRALAAPNAPVLPLQLHAPPRVNFPAAGRP